MIFAPRSRLTRRLGGRASLLFVGLGLAYDAMLAGPAGLSLYLVQRRAPLDG